MQCFPLSYEAATDYLCQIMGGTKCANVTLMRQQYDDIEGRYSIYDFYVETT